MKRVMRRPSARGGRERRPSRFLRPSGAADAEAAWLSELKPGLTAGVLYEDEDLYHERLLIWPVAPKLGDWFVMTPDSDVYVEGLGCGGGDDCPIQAFRCSADGLAPSLAEGRFYRFTGFPSKDELRKLMIDARQITEAGEDPPPTPKMTLLPDGTPTSTQAFLKLSEGSSGKAGGAQLTKAKAKSKAEKTEIEKAGGKADPGSEQMSMIKTTGFEEEVWVALESSGGYEKGAVVEMTDGDVTLGSRGVHRGEDGEVAVSLVPDGEEDPEPSAKKTDKRKESDDARLLGELVYDTKGRRWIEYGAAVKEMVQEHSADFPLSGERTVEWLCSYTLGHGGSFDGRHTKWCLEQKIDKDSAAAVAHDLLGYSIELALCWDQVDASNLACLELISRTYQLVEETAGALQMEGLEHFIGRDSGAGLRRGIAVAPLLARHATQRQAEETAIMKEKRKAREEKALASNPGAGGKPAHQKK